MKTILATTFLLIMHTLSYGQYIVFNNQPSGALGELEGVYPDMTGEEVKKFDGKHYTHYLVKTPYVIVFRKLEGQNYRWGFYSRDTQEGAKKVLANEKKYATKEKRKPIPMKIFFLGDKKDTKAETK